MAERRHWPVRFLAEIVVLTLAGPRAGQCRVRPGQALVRLGTRRPAHRPVGRRAARGAQAAGLRGRPGRREDGLGRRRRPGQGGGHRATVPAQGGAGQALRRAGDRPVHGTPGVPPGRPDDHAGVDDQAAHLHRCPGDPRPDGEVPHVRHLVGRLPPARPRRRRGPVPGQHAPPRPGRLPEPGRRRDPGAAHGAQAEGDERHPRPPLLRRLLLLRTVGQPRLAGHLPSRGGGPADQCSLGRRGPHGCRLRIRVRGRPGAPPPPGPSGRR